MNRAIFSFRFPALLVLFVCTGGSMQSVSAQEAESDEMQQFLDLLNQQTELATNTRINADYVPGMLSVLNAEQLQRRGFRTLWEALASLPGVQTNMNETGMRSITVRGIGGLFEPSKIKLLLNGKAVNASASATTGTIYDTPVDQIERIEFIRGPGSAIHGEFAYSGVLNVITHKSGEAYTAGVESVGGLGFSARYNFDSDDGNFRTSLSIAANQSEGEDIDSGADRSPTGIPTYAPGPVNNKRDFFSAILDIEAGSLTALLQIQQGNRGDHFGTNYLLPPDERQTVISDTVISADLSQTFELEETLTGEWSVNLLQNKTEQNSLFFGVAEFFDPFSTLDDIVADSLLEERRLETSVNLQYEQGAHQLFGELIITQIDVGESEQFINLISPIIRLPSPTMNEFPGPVDKSASRSSISLVVQDEYKIDDQLTLTAGMRYDDYEDIGDNLSPRLALVWRRSDQHIFKAQLARAFKPPSLVETGGSIEVSIDPEINDTLEFGHIYRDTELVVRNILFSTRLDDLILFQDVAPIGYKNAEAFSLYGYELEIEHRIDSDWNINGSLSLQDYAGEELPGAVPWMLKLGVEFRIEPMTTLHLQINSIAERERESGDTRDDFGQINQLDFALQSQKLFGIGGLRLRLGIQNLLDDRLAFPAAASTYPDDYAYSDGASLWAQISYQP